MKKWAAFIGMNYDCSWIEELAEDEVSDGEFNGVYPHGRCKFYLDDGSFEWVGCEFFTNKWQAIKFLEEYWEMTPDDF